MPKKRRPISGFTDLSSRDCQITDDSKTQFSVNDRDDSDERDSIPIEAVAEHSSENDDFGNDRDDSDERDSIPVDIENVDLTASTYSKEGFDDYKRQISKAIEAQLERESQASVLNKIKESEGLDSTFKRDDDSQFDKLGDSYNMCLKEPSTFDGTINDRASTISKTRLKDLVNAAAESDDEEQVATIYDETVSPDK